jgi:nucleoside-diphosphate-sugar epimerase
MKILFTGASSFTGFWFTKELAKRGHQICAIFRKTPSDYRGIRRQRIEQLRSHCHLIFECEFGSAPFLDLISYESSWDLLCHHASEVSDYKSPHFDYLQAVAANTKNISPILRSLQERACHRLILTGTVFEPSEGGDPFTCAASPYGLSKGLTYEVFKYYSQIYGLQLGKFVIPNPFGPFEEFRFTSFLVKSWLEGSSPTILTPAYVRDNIHVDLLAQCYVDFCERSERDVSRPSGYVETQGGFAKRFSKEMGSRLSLPCDLQIKEQTEFLEPLIRHNSDRPSVVWDEKGAWDSLAAYYISTIKENKL